jgi:hypothetical protein
MRVQTGRNKDKAVVIKDYFYEEEEDQVYYKCRSIE